jgi:RIO-like serine/threonine protein kinase
MVSIHHPNSEEFVIRDFSCVCIFFERRFGIFPMDPPILTDNLQLVDLENNSRYLATNFKRMEMMAVL